MSNEEKARELSHDYFRRGQLRLVSPDSESAGYECAMQMAEWKDGQIINLIQKIITCVDQGITQCATDTAIAKELTNLIKGAKNYENSNIINVRNGNH